MDEDPNDPLVGKGVLSPQGSARVQRRPSGQDEDMRPPHTWWAYDFKSFKGMKKVSSRNFPTKRQEERAHL